MTLSRVRTLPPGAERERYLPLLYLADDSIVQVHGYYQLGDLYAAVDDVGAPVAVVLAIAQAQHGVVELKSVAVATPLQRHGLGRQLLIAVLDELRLRGTRRVVVGTSSSSIGALAFYQRAGFRVWKVERDFFCPARGYPPRLEEDGIPVRDMLWLDQDLRESSFCSQQAQ